MNADYCIGALDILLDVDCLPARYAPLVPYKHALIAGLYDLGCVRKADVEALDDEALLRLLSDAGLVRLFRRFLALYDLAPQKFREIDSVAQDETERAAFRELYCLPGVRSVRAALYCRAGYRTLSDFTAATVEDVRARTALVISRDGFDCIVPLPKEVRTHIAVARAFLWDGEETKSL